MIFFNKRHKYYPTPNGCEENLAMDIFLKNRKKIERVIKKKVKFIKAHHFKGYVDYIVYEVKEEE